MTPDPQPVDVYLSFVHFHAGEEDKTILSLHTSKYDIMDINGFKLVLK